MNVFNIFVSIHTMVRAQVNIFRGSSDHILLQQYSQRKRQWIELAWALTHLTPAIRSIYFSWPYMVVGGSRDIYGAYVQYHQLGVCVICMRQTQCQLNSSNLSEHASSSRHMHHHHHHHPFRPVAFFQALNSLSGYI